MTALCWGLVAASDEPRVLASIVPGAVIALIGVGLPNYLGQVALQLLDGRLHVSMFTIAGIVGVSVLGAVGVLARSRHERLPPVPLDGPRPAVLNPPGP